MGLPGPGPDPLHPAWAAEVVDPLGHHASAVTPKKDPPRPNDTKRQFQTPLAGRVLRDAHIIEHRIRAHGCVVHRPPGHRKHHHAQAQGEQQVAISGANRTFLGLQARHPGLQLVRVPHVCPGKRRQTGWAQRSP